MSAAEPIRRTVAQGVLRGSRDGGLVRFRGVPYAQPPVDELRFRDPQPPKPWQGERDATAFGPRCPQPSFGILSPPSKTPADEDCLYLNVTARDDGSARRPVLVFFHGGLNLIGDSFYPERGGGHLLDGSDAVLVTVGFRLGPFGYVHFDEFSTGKRPFDSNLGTKDQLAALRWVQENIGSFGGDPGNVTVWGQSSGANAVATLLAVPEARGLFAKAILHSPPAGAVLDKADGELYARMFLEALGAQPGEAQLALTRARQEELVGAVAKLGKLVPARRPGARHIAPMVDGAFLPERVLEAFSAGRTHPVPVIVGTNKDDVIVQLKWGGLAAEATDLRTALARCDPTRAAGADELYPGLPKRRSSAISLGGDLRYWIPSVALAEGQSRLAPTYMYRYEWSSRLTRLLGFGATHGIELLACFGPAEGPAPAVLALSGREERAELAHASANLRRRWLAFAQTGTPGDAWPAYRAEDRQTLLLGPRETAQSDPRAQHRRFWSGFDMAGLNHAASAR
ncbi:Carboxylesterase [Segniliparus rotundus DSM 44985]|uniref:Carboxylic ester hydrolase n=1 Tax=Segniliparus rotundus (strain ATCC BAA-972 / CDC 1076 / CIP 108378 / DSM 44985 / JCM 13578) TaxID=640132 RepID=D6ZCA1_SEGRD|nr:carboxylesterase family protein [Segniliparus rotundus]ADG99070.1 Carboxylesterase [Segniliparus rotundus DSM 44985]